MGGNITKELKLAKYLQDQCDDKGKEINPKESAYILREFALLYKEKSPDKISLIFSATFLNAAIVRQNTNSQFRKDLRELCLHVLQVAEAEKPQTDLESISKEALEMIKEMRWHTDESLKKIQVIPCGLPDDELKAYEEKHIKHVRLLQKDISKRYKNLMDFIGKKSVQAMGNPPCKYSITGMGSLARDEITPFSDFEHIILLEEGVQNRKNYFEIVEYFRWVSVIFHIIIINLRETIIRSVAVPWLNDDSIKGGDWFFDAPTKCGIKFDGMQLHACKIPLGRTRKTGNKPFTVELIQPVSRMVKFLEMEEDVKHGYHLADVLSKTCFVSGNFEVHDNFQGLVKHALSKEWATSLSLNTEEVRQYFKSFDILKHSSLLGIAPKCNIKSLLYRTSTLFISALGRIHSISNHSCFEIVDVLNKKGLISPEWRHNLLYIISLSCISRLRVYTKTKGQDDFVGPIQTFDFFKTLHQLSEIIGDQSLGDYFTLTISLQKAMKDGISLNLEAIKLSEKFEILLVLQLCDRILIDWEVYSQKRNTEQFHDDIKIRSVVADVHKIYKNFDEALQIYSYLIQQKDIRHDIITSVMVGKAECLRDLNLNSEGIEFISDCKSKVKSLILTRENLCHVQCVLNQCDGVCKQRLELYSDACDSYHESLSMWSESEHFMEVNSVVNCHVCMGLCLAKMGKLEEAINSGKTALSLCQSQQITDVTTCNCFSLLQFCYLEQNNLPLALKYFVQDLHFRLSITTCAEQDSDKQIARLKEVIHSLS